MVIFIAFIDKKNLKERVFLDINEKDKLGRVSLWGKDKETERFGVKNLPSFVVF